MIDLLVIVILLNFFKLKRELTNSIIFTTISILSLFIINFFFAVSEQSLDKYLYYVTVVLSSVMFYVHFKNNRGNQIFLLRLNFILKTKSKPPPVKTRNKTSKLSVYFSLKE